MPSQGAGRKVGSPSAKLEGPRLRLGVYQPNYEGHTEAWKSITPTKVADLKRGSPNPKPEWPRRILSPQLEGDTEVWESITPTQGARLKLGCP